MTHPYRTSATAAPERPWWWAYVAWAMPLCARYAWFRSIVGGRWSWRYARAGDPVGRWYEWARVDGCPGAFNSEQAGGGRTPHGICFDDRGLVCHCDGRGGIHYGIAHNCFCEVWR